MRSLLRYGVPELVGRNTAEAIARGYRHIKLHEVDLALHQGGPRRAPPEAPVMLDINCAWDTVEQGIAFCLGVKDSDNRWVEEPVWPPEDFSGDCPPGAARGRHRHRRRARAIPCSTPPPSAR